jgi:hypothetical protein
LYTKILKLIKINLVLVFELSERSTDNGLYANINNSVNDKIMDFLNCLSDLR